MRARHFLSGKVYDLRITTDHSASSYGQPVIVTSDGEAIDKFSWRYYELLEVTDEELDELRKAGY